MMESFMCLVRRAVLCVIASSVACKFPPPPDVPDDGDIAGDASIDAPDGSIGGTVSGMWAGGTLVVRLQATGIDELLDVSANGLFSFSNRLSAGALYTVTVDEQPGHHRCSVANGVGTAPTGAVTNIAVTCDVDFAVDISLSAPITWSFDVDVEQYDLSTSIAVQETSVVVTAPVATHISINDAPATSGGASPPVQLPFGPSTIRVAIEVDSLSRSYELAVNRGAAPLGSGAYVKPTNTGSEDAFGGDPEPFIRVDRRIAISADVLVIGAALEDSSSATSSQDNTLTDSGAAYVFRRTNGVWMQEAVLKASNRGANDHFGSSVAIDRDYIAVSAPGEDSSATGVNSSAADTAMDSGAVYVFRRNGTAWTQDAYIKASNTGAGDQFGKSIAISGTTLVVGAPDEDSNGIPSDNSRSNSGAVYVFDRGGAGWSQTDYRKAPNADAGDMFGSSVALIGDLLAVGAPAESSGAAGVNQNQADNSVSAAGAVYVLRRGGLGWQQEAYLKASNPGATDFFGITVAVAPDTIAVGASGEDSNATNVNGPQANEGASNSGAVYVFRRGASAWAQEAYVKSANTDTADNFGASGLALHGDLLAVAAHLEDSTATGVGPVAIDNGRSNSGAVYVYRRDGAAWSFATYVKASNPGADDLFGAGLALSGDTLFVGAPGEDSSATGIDGLQSDDGAINSGAAYTYR